MTYIKPINPNRLPASDVAIFSTAFPANVTNWTKYGNATLSWDGTVGRTTNGSLKLAFSTDAWSGAFYTIPANTVPLGSVLTFSTYVRADATGNTKHVQLLLQEENSGINTTSLSTPLSNSEWKLLTLTHRTRSTSAMTIHIQGKNDYNGAIFWADDLTVTRANILQPDVHPVIRRFGRRIYKDGAPFIIRGWGYYNPPIGSGSGYDWTSSLSQIPYDIDDIAAAGANCIRIYQTNYTNNANKYKQALDYCYAKGISVIVDKYIPHNTNYSVATGGANRAAAIASIQAMVTQLGYHPAIIGFGIGNEVNYELGGTPINDWWSLLEACCQAGKAINSNKLYTTSNGGTTSAMTANSLVPSLDMWGVTVYRGVTFGSMLKEVSEGTDKPVFLTEYGYDSVDDGVEDEAGQSTRVRALVEELESYYPYLSGGFIFEWADEWWKHGGEGTEWTTHDPGGFAGADDRDGIMDEEYWGTTEALAAGVFQSRVKKPVYANISNYWNKR